MTESIVSGAKADDATRARRSGDKVGFASFTCWLARRLTELWDFIDQRDIDKHAMAWGVFAITGYMLYWTMEFVWAHPDKPGLEVGAIITALMVPWTPVQAAVVSWYFRART